MPRGMGSALPFLKCYFNFSCARHSMFVKSPLFSPFVFRCLRTLSFSVSCNSFASHSYENCRVYTNNSHFGLTRGCSKGSPSLPRAQRGAVAAKGTQRPHEQALALTRGAKQHTFRHRWNPSPSADEKPITCRGHRCWNDCDCGISAGGAQIVALPALATALLRWIAIFLIAANATSRRSLTGWILVGLLAGAELGHDAPSVALKLQFLGTIFLRLIKVIIAPLLFGTLVVGSRGMRT